MRDPSAILSLPTTMNPYRLAAGFERLTDAPHSTRRIATSANAANSMFAPPSALFVTREPFARLPANDPPERCAHIDPAARLLRDDDTGVVSRSQSRTDEFRQHHSTLELL
ncbi:hypothetical protein MPH_03981 [Macrophomina phaseolina MS6]|uniref:Uncharacterized protein n=1 Tax=Macrophomina phaseolina (strain MS6) TaxID=1126212 RepID=K2SPQ9_MACPH|nr:hypothetical protein MPH_03981 [Macrophomina phaseolina MS6]